MKLPLVYELFILTFVPSSSQLLPSNWQRITKDSSSCDKGFHFDSIWCFDFSVTFPVFKTVCRDRCKGKCTLSSIKLIIWFEHEQKIVSTGKKSETTHMVHLTHLWILFFICFKSRDNLFDKIFIQASNSHMSRILKCTQPS